MKQYLVTASEMKRYDANTIEQYHMPPLLLMERAALVTVEELQRARGTVPCRVLVVAGTGNNGGDGLAVGRLLMLSGYEVTFVLTGSEDRCTRETARQLIILRAYGAEIFSTIKDCEYDIVIDALFGIGLSRPAKGAYADAIRLINGCRAYVCSVDIPSGVHADTGEVMGCAVQADLTVTYGFRKLGQILYPGCAYTGALVCRGMGIDGRSFLSTEPYWYTYSGRDNDVLLQRRPDGNKGTFGKALLIVGNSEIGGAALLAVKSAFRIGTGMVKVVTAVQNREILQQSVPEAMLLTYLVRHEMLCDGGSAWGDAALCGEAGVHDGNSLQGETDGFMAKMEEAVAWADAILIGPGTGVGRQAKELLTFCLTRSMLPLVIDADGINLLAGDSKLQEALSDGGRQGRTIVLTPHLGEFARLYGCSVMQAKAHLTEYPRELAARLKCTVVCKDARTVVAGKDNRQGYLNTTGNSGMATAGAGDVLAGMLTGLLAQKMPGEEAAAAAVYLHGTAGDIAAQRETEMCMTATDIIAAIKDAALLQDAVKETESKAARK